MKISLVLGGLFLLSGALVLGRFALQGTDGIVPVAETVGEGSAVPGESGTLTLSVPGMHCEFACAPKVRETLADVPGVEGVETDVDSKTATIELGDGFTLNTALAKLEEAGFPATQK